MNYPIRNELLLSLTAVFGLEFLLYDDWHREPPMVEFLVNAYLGKRLVMFHLLDSRKWIHVRTGQTKEEAERRFADDITRCGATVADVITFDRLFDIPSFSTLEELRMKIELGGKEN